MTAAAERLASLATVPVAILIPLLVVAWLIQPTSLGARLKIQIRDIPLVDLLAQIVAIVVAGMGFCAYVQHRSFAQIMTLTAIAVGLSTLLGWLDQRTRGLGASG